MTYALAAATYDRFRLALGRDPQWSFARHPQDLAGQEEVIKLHIHPHAFEEDNAFYDPDLGALRFGYTRAGRLAAGLTQPHALVFSALSHDVVVHETTHALLDGMRAWFMLPTSPDVDGFHEGFSDLVALFQRFTYRDLVKKGIAEAKGEVTSRLLVDLARQFGAATTDGKTPMRTAFLTPGSLDEEVPKAQRYRPGLEAHDMGAVLMRAVFDAYRYIFDEKTKQLRSLAAEGARLPEALIDLLAGEAVRLAGQFLTLLIRAVDYCPPVDLRLGEYLRAIVTADFDLVPDDPWGYREAIVRGFRRHGVQVDDVIDLTESALLWRGPERRLRVPNMGGAARAKRIEEGRRKGRYRKATDPEIQRRRAHLLGVFVTRPENLHSFGLAPASPRRKIEKPVIESVRRVVRAGPDGTVNVDLIAEVVQRRRVERRWMHGGSTVILRESGDIRYIIAKHVLSGRREERILRHLAAAPRADRQVFEDGAKTAMRLRRLHRGRRGQ
jgi:hypothetical protein